MTPYGDISLGQHCSGNGLMPDGTKPLPEPMLTYHQCSIQMTVFGRSGQRGPPALAHVEYSRSRDHVRSFNLRPWTGNPARERMQRPSSARWSSVHVSDLWSQVIDNTKSWTVLFVFQRDIRIVSDINSPRHLKWVCFLSTAE